MPLTSKGEKILSNMEREYGTKKGKSVFYASANKGTISGVEPGKKNGGLISKYNLRKKKNGGEYGLGGPVSTTSSDSTKTSKPDYYDTDISKATVKAHKPDYYDTDISKVKVNAHATPGKAYGGAIEGPGSSMSDSIPAKIKKGSFVVPAQHAVLAELLRQDMLQGKPDEKADLNQKDGSPVRLSNGEHLFNPKEADFIHKKLKNPTGINMLAPNSDKKFKLNNLLNHGSRNRSKK